MHRKSMDFSGVATLIGGSSLIAATLLFSAVFVYLARSFGYPDVLDLPAADVLPRLLALGNMGRAVWIVYGLVPLLLIPTAIGVIAAAGSAAPLISRAALTMAVLSAVTMMAGLLRWPSLHWQLALAYADATSGAREAISVTFAASNSYLGNFIGEFLGELFLNAFFLFASIALTRAASASGRWLLVVGSSASLLGGLAMLRNATSCVEPIAEVNNVVLPVGMLVLGVVVLRYRTGASSFVPLPTASRA